MVTTAWIYQIRWCAPRLMWLMCPELLELGRWKQKFRFRPLPNKADIEEVWPFLVEVFLRRPCQTMQEKIPGIFEGLDFIGRIPKNHGTFTVAKRYPQLYYYWASICLASVSNFPLAIYHTWINLKPTGQAPWARPYSNESGNPCIPASLCESKERIVDGSSGSQYATMETLVFARKEAEEMQKTSTSTMCILHTIK